MEIEGVLQLNGYIPDFFVWDDTINLSEKNIFLIVVLILI